MSFSMTQAADGLKAGPFPPTAPSVLKVEPVSVVDFDAVSYEETEVTTITDETKTTKVAKVSEMHVADTEVVDITSSSDISVSPSDNSWTKPEVSVPAVVTNEVTPVKTSTGRYFTRFDSYVPTSPPPKLSTATTVTTVAESASTVVGSGTSVSTTTAAFQNLKLGVKKSFGGAGLKHGVVQSKKLIIGIDFGTTFTGIAYGLTSDPTNIKIVKKWPGIQGRNDIVKIPTTIQYGSVNDNNIKDVDFVWGYKIKDNAERVIRGFKLGLDPAKRGFWTKAVGISEDDDMMLFHEETTMVEMERLYRSTVQIVADYLGAVYKHAIAKIAKDEMTGVLELPRQFVITVPAIWSDQAKTATLNAARLAHADMKFVSPEDLVTEPEAAALYALQSFRNRGFKTGDTFVLCDAGGGTVDLISYKITSLYPRMQVKEVVSATGAAVGSMMINNGFERYLRQILGDDVLARMKDKGGVAFNAVMREFDQKIKPYFQSAEHWDDGGDEDDDAINNIINLGITIDDDPDHNITDNNLTITGDVLEEIFDPLVTATEKLVREQIDGVKQSNGRGPNYIFLVGGFGASPYLNRRLEEMVAGESIQVLRPEDAQAAVVKGAVLFKMPNTAQVIASILPTSLGVKASVLYDSLEHTSPSAILHAFTDANEGVTRIPKMTWFIMKGAELERDDRVRFPCYRDVPLDYYPENLRFTDELQESDEPLPPKFPWEGKGVKRKCVLTSDLNGIDPGQLVRRKDPNGCEYYSVHYELVVAIRSAILTFSVECQGRTFAIANVEF
ncbi:hypothetical protein QBC47DRAFT_3712 [Echria macrotheca]|uniref:Actin-like ATPase domain-containing protein n=1 Tax=Echria macrotheca TaxID=438768 RepID=A0AAJ0FFW0_9PEZI|nr:hypothetical protein QBC47DRAFT_3712 [Echria macrotheca]